MDERDKRVHFMNPSGTKDERQKIEQAIAAQEHLRGTVDDAIIDKTITSLKKELTALDSPPKQQRKLATILFMDLAKHTALIRGMDPEDQMALIDPLIARLAEKVNQHGGRVARYQGDGFKAVFGLPIARENDPEQAIHAGLAMQAEAEAISAELESEHGLSGFQLRVGITTGLVFAGGETEGEDTVKGPPVNLAARLESATQPGTVLISYDTYKFVRGVFDLEPLEPIQAKGFPEPVPVYRVLRAKPRAFYRGMRLVEGIETRMIGRQAELETLKDAYYTVVEDGEPQIVTIIGEAGLGKSRLLYEFENWIDLQPEQVRLYRGRAHLESQRLPYDLLRSIFAFRFDIRDDDSLEVVQEKWLAGFAEAWGDSPTDLPPEKVEMRAHILGQLLGYDFAASPHVGPILGDPQQLRDRSLVYLEDYFKAVTQSTPVLVLLEDLHWADDSSLEALSRLGLILRETPVLIVSAARPGLYERHPYWFEGRDFHRRVDLKPLSKRLNRQLVNEVLQNIPDIPDTLSDLIVSNAEGNPFYVEELVKVLVEAGVIVKGDPHWTVAEKRLEEMDVPATLTGVLQARLERLPNAERILIQQASVVGRVFWDQAVWYLNHQGDGVLDELGIQDGLANLRGKELIYRRELSVFQEAREYIFKHAVLREVTYESVLKKLRRVYHALAAEWLMEQRSDRSGEVIGLIADHLELAGERGETLRYLKLAGEQAAEKYANEEAVDYFSRALELVPEEDLEICFELLLAREEVLNLQAKLELQRQDLEALEFLAKEMDSIENQLEVGVRWSNYLWMINDYQAAAETAERVVAQAELTGNLQFAARGHFRWGKALIWQFQYETADEHLNKALAGFRAVGDHRMEGKTLRMIGSVAAGLNDLQAWKDYSQQALVIARQIGDRSDEAEAINHLSNIFLLQGDYATGRKYLYQYLEIAQEIGSLDQEKMALSNLGAIANTLKDYSAALDYYEKSLSIAQAIGVLGEIPNGLGEAYAGLEQWDKAAQYYLQALELFEETGEDWGIARSRNGLARAALAQGDVEEALNQVDGILAYLEGGKGLGYGRGLTESYLICVQVLQAAGDPRTDQVLKSGHAELQGRATKIKDPEIRKSFLGNVPYNRELVKLCEVQQLDQN
jgi:predicted ATPase/class 3 adenylate cyclase